MEVNDALILKLEKLARLQLDTESRTRFGQDLGKMLQMVDKLQLIDTTGVQPLVYMNEEASLPAEDLVAEQLPREVALKNAPQKNEAYFMVPKVIEKG
jgi:aspartyl-tRNA(Asn)/glutamyl-tRNA(Gln) amidotransferase subunit C